MTFPAFLLGMVISSLLGAGFHLVLGGHFGRLLAFLVSSWLGFWGGHLLGDGLGWIFLSVGSLRLGTALLGNLIGLGLGYWLSLIKTEEKTR